STKDHTCRVAYSQARRATADTTCHYEVKIARDPVDREVTTIAAFTGNHNNQRGVESGLYNWPASMWFPHSDITCHVAVHQPDVMYFSGDQVYENASPTGVDRKFLELDYLYKWYLWCWAYRDLTREIVSVCVPDDHDVYQGNLWGQGGRPAKNQGMGGYVYPAEFVKMVERTQTCHLPDPYDPTPVEQGIGVYYTGLDFGGVSYAILEDRKFKTGEESEESLSKDPTRIKLLGDRQLDFLSHWAADWAPGVEMKCVLSQTIFGCLHTGWGTRAFKKDLPADDYDSNGWPSHGRNKALREIRKGFAFMIGGDQHLATIVHHGIDEFDGAGWSFCVPSVANFYPRSWMPEIPADRALPGLPEYTGSYHDGFGNKVTVWAAANPIGSTGAEPAALHDRSPGYGIVHFNKKARTVQMECWPRYADPDRDEMQYKGWPKTIDMLDNYGKKPVAWLPTIEVSGFDKPVLQVIDQRYGDTVYTLRLPGNSFRPWVFREGPYTLRIGQPGTDRLKVIADVEATEDKTEDVIKVDF
ncbi:MAG: twin-arginine translocation pathway signal protein, partial [Planctomycetota bacterium]